MRILYSLVLYLLLPLALLRLLWRRIGEPAGPARLPERFGATPPPADDRPVIWIHAVSVGEVRTAAVLVNRLLRAAPRCQVLMTTVTPTGAAQVERLFADRVAHRYLPYDLPLAVQGFLRAVRPRLLIIMETEIWPNLLYYCERRGVPAFLVNARLSPGSYRGYRRLRRFTAAALRRLSRIAAQSEADAERFLALGAPPEKTSVAGNMKFDAPAPAGAAASVACAAASGAGAGRPTWMAASTHEGEEQLVLEAFQQVRRSLADCLLMIAPRHPERFDKAAALCRRRGFSVARRTREGSGKPPPDADVYLVDTLGELPALYGYADAAFVGGSLAPAGGHNVLEPVRLGVPVVSGPHTENFREIIDLLKAEDAIAVVADAAGLAAAVTRLLTDADLRRVRGERGRRLAERRRGAADAVMALLQEHLSGL